MECVYFKFEDADGFGWCSLLEEADVNRQDEACCEFEETMSNDPVFMEMLQELATEVRLLRQAFEKLQMQGANAKFLTMADACDYLHISRTTMTKRIADGEIGFAVKKGKSWLFPEEKLKAYASGMA